MTDRHWHWSFRCDDYMAMFTYETRQEAEEAMNYVTSSALEKEVFELPCDCGKTIQIGDKG